MPFTMMATCNSNRTPTGDHEKIRKCFDLRSAPEPARWQLARRQYKPKRRALAELALHPNSPAMRLDQLVADMQSQTQPAARFLIDLPKAFEHMRQCVCANPGTVVADDELDLIPALLYIHADYAVFGPLELHRVA